MSRLATLVFSVMTLLPFTVSAQVQRLSIQVQREFRAGAIFPLKQEIQRQHRVDLNRYELESVSVLAKSYQGQGVISLQVGRAQVRSTPIPGNPRDYRDHYPTTFTPIRLQAPRAQAQQDWLLAFQGQISVQNIQVTLRPSAYRPTPGPRPGPNPFPNPFPAPAPQVQFAAEGQFRLEKFIESSRSFNIRKSNVKVIQIQALKNDANISQARAVLSNGREVFLDSLTGHLRKDRVTQFAFPDFNGVNVQSVYFSGTTYGLTGSRAELKVDIGVVRY